MSTHGRGGALGVVHVAAAGGPGEGSEKKLAIITANGVNKPYRRGDWQLRQAAIRREGLVCRIEIIALVHPVEMALKFM